jgi:hypothetical protein
VTVQELAAARAELEELKGVRQQLLVAQAQLSELQAARQNLLTESGEQGVQLEALRVEVAGLRAQAAEIPALRQQLVAARAESEKLAAGAREAEEAGGMREELAAARAQIEELQAKAEDMEAKHQELIALARTIPSDFASFNLAGILSILPPHLIDFARVFAVLKQLIDRVSGGVPANDAEAHKLLEMLRDMLTSLKQERETIEANVESLAKQAREGQAAADAEAGHLRNLASRIISGLTGQGAGAQADSREVGAVADLAPLPGPARRFGWTKVADSPEWQRVRARAVMVDAAELYRLFGTGDIPAGKLLSPRTERQFQLALKKIGRTPEDIALAVRRESFGLGEPAILNVLRLPTSAHELANLLNFNGNAASLGDAERLAVLLHRIPSFREKARSMIELHRFDVAISVIMQGLTKFNDGVNKLEKQSPNLHRALAVVLRIGNQINAGTDTGGAAGFTLNDVLELRFMKTNDKGFRLLHAAVKILAANGIDIAKVKQEADALVPASRVSLEGILEALKLAEFQLAQRPRVPFVLSSAQRVREAIGKIQAAQLARDRVTRGFGVREELMKGSGLLLVLIDLAGELNRALKENAAREAKMVVAAAPKPKPAAPSSDRADVPDESQQRGFVATMVGTLKRTATRSAKRGVAEKHGGEEDDTDFSTAVAKVRQMVS